MTWAWSIALPPTPKLVLMALADIADDLGICWPSHPTLAAKCSMTDRNVRRILSLLQARKLVFIEPRFKTTGSRTTNRYRLAVDTPQDNLSGGPRTPMAGGRGQPCPGAPDTRVLATTTEPSIEPSLPPPAPDRATRPCAPVGGGSSDLLYPKTLTPRQSQALQARLIVLNHAQAQEVLDELSGRMAIAQVRNPLRYCTTLIERMQRGEFLPELGLKVGDARQAERQAELARIETISVSRSRAGPREVPIEFREAMKRILPRSRVLSKKGY